MSRSARFFAAFSLTAAAALVLWLGCDTGQPQLVFGPNVSGSQAPALTILTPNSTTNLNQGQRLVITWDDSDADSAARITFTLVNIATGGEIVLIANVEENNALDEISVGTSLVPQASYWLRGDITDGTKSATTYALLAGSTSTRAVVTIGEPGTNPLSVPPRVAVVAPQFNLGVAQDDVLQIVVRPTTDLLDTTTPFDLDSDATLYVLLDLDEDPTNDDPQLANPEGIIVLQTRALVQGEVEPQQFPINIDLAAIPQRANGDPYYIRATIVDDSNAPVHGYAAGTINIVQSAVNPVDVAQVGFTLAGARFQGFNPGSRLGNRMTTVSDFDADGVDDFLLLAQFGNPRNFGNIGEGYLIYGRDGERYGGSSNVNSVSSTIPGVIFEGMPQRLDSFHQAPEADPRGLVSAFYIPDLSGDGRPEILLGMPMADGMFQGRDDDPNDDPGDQLVQITLRQEFASVRVDGVLEEDFGDEYTGFSDTYISRTQPNAAFGTAAVMDLAAAQVVDEDNPADKFPIVWAFNIGQFFTTLDPDSIDELNATLTLNVPAGANVPGDGAFSAHQINVAPDENLVYADFGNDGEPGPTEDNEYEAADLEVSTDFIGRSISIDVTETIQAWIDREISAARVGWILVPIEIVDSSFVTSEGASDNLRPTLSIQYTEQVGGTNYNCYPDSFANNFSDEDDGGVIDSSLEAQGAVFVVNSENRDTDSRVFDPDRLTTTSMAIELIGQEDVIIGPRTAWRLGIVGDPDNPSSGQVGGTIRHLASDGSKQSRGIRITGGYWEYVNSGNYGEAAPRTDYFGERVTHIPDMNNDDVPEFLISAPRNELYLDQLRSDDSNASRTIRSSTAYSGSIIVIPGLDRSLSFLDPEGNATIPTPLAGGSCSTPVASRGGLTIPSDGFQIYAEDITDWLGYAEHAGDVNLDGVPDIVCGAKFNDHPTGITDTGAVYIVYGRRPLGNVSLANLDFPEFRPPTLRIRGRTANDRLGQVQTSGLDINGDRIADIFFGSPDVDYPEGLSAAASGDTVCDRLGNAELNLGTFNACRQNYGDEVFADDACKVYDFDNDRDIDGDDRNVFDCLVGGFSNCCPVDNGFVGVVFGDIQLDGDRDFTQIGTFDLPGLKFYGANPGDRVGADIVSAGDFNRDGYGDLLIAAPGVEFTDNNGRARLGVAYLVFGGTHLNGNLSFSLAQVGQPELPGIIFLSPFELGRPNEAPIDHVGLLGDINADGFDDIALGMTRADFLDSALPQSPNDPGSNPNIGRRPDDGNVYIIYGNNTGSNR